VLWLQLEDGKLVEQRVFRDAKGLSDSLDTVDK